MVGDRLTRSVAARFLWGGLVVLCLIGLFLTRSQKATALNDEIADAQERSTGYARTTIADLAIVDSRAGTITFDKKGFEIGTEGDVFTDPTVARLRVWDKDGLLLASTDPTEAVGQAVATDPHLQTALDDHPSYAVINDEPFTYSTVGTPTVPTDLLETFGPFLVKDQVQPVGVVQVDFLYGKLQAAAARPWDKVARGFTFFALLFGVLFVFSMIRRPIPREQRLAALTPTGEVPAPRPAAPVDERNVALEDELHVAREQLQQASEAFAFLEAKMKDGSGGQAAAVDVDAAMARVEFEGALRRAEDDAAEARTNAVSQDELEQGRREADERVAELQRQMQEDAARPDPELEELKTRVAEAKARAQHAEDALATARADVRAAREEAEAVPDSPADGGLIEEFEAKVAEAEARAKEAEEEALRITPEANDLRAKLTQAAARKKLGSSS